MCLAIVIAAFQRRAFLAFPPIKHEKQQKQHAVFLMHWPGGVGLTTPQSASGKLQICFFCLKKPEKRE